MVGVAVNVTLDPAQVGLVPLVSAMTTDATGAVTVASVIVTEGATIA